MASRVPERRTHLSLSILIAVFRNAAYRKRRKRIGLPVFICRFNALASLVGSDEFVAVSTPPIPRHPGVFPESPF